MSVFCIKCRHFIIGGDFNEKEFCSMEGEKVWKKTHADNFYSIEYKLPPEIKNANNDCKDYKPWPWWHMESEMEMIYSVLAKPKKRNIE